MEENRVFIAFGSNLGDRVAMVEQACQRMEERGIKIKRTSSLFETAPMYVTDQGSFINGVCEVSTACHLDAPVVNHAIDCFVEYIFDGIDDILDIAISNTRLPYVGCNHPWPDRVAGYASVDRT